MKLILSFALALGLMAGALAAYAQEKQPDTVDAVSSGLRTTITGELTTASPTYNRTLSGGPSLTCNANVALSGVGTNVYYAVHCFWVSDTNPITMVVNDAGTSIGDTFITIYCDPFDPAAPRANEVIADDDDGAGLLSAILLTDNVHLTPGANYYLVSTTFGNGQTGTYQIDASDNVVGCGATPIETTTWGVIKSVYR